MIPAKTDPRWRDLVSGKKEVQFTGLATKIFFTRVKLMATKKEEAAVAQAITLAHEFFTKNEASAAADLRLVFG
jgi:hypothetical protein